MGFPRQEYWSRLPFPTPADLSDPGIKPSSFVFPALAGGFFTTGATLECGDLIPSPMKTEKDPSSKCSMKSESESHSVVSDSLRPHGLYVVQGILQARILEWEAFPFSRGIFPNQRSNSGLLHCRWILYQLSHK